MKSFCFILFFILFNANKQQLLASDIEQGKETFKRRCTSCHTIFKTMVGPALNNVDKKHELKWFIKFVRSSKKMIAAGDKKAIKIYNEFMKVPMNEHNDLTDEQITNVYQYIKSASGEQNSTTSANVVDSVVTEPVAEEKSNTLVYVLGIVASLGLILFLALKLFGKKK